MDTKEPLSILNREVTWLTLCLEGSYPVGLKVGVNVRKEARDEGLVVEKLGFMLTSLWGKWGTGPAGKIMDLVMSTP